MANAVTGVADVQKQLQLIRERMTGKGMRAAVRAAGKVMEAAMIERAPVLTEKTPGSNSLEPGALRNDIHTKVLTRADEVAAVTGTSSATGHVGIWIEFGHKLVKGKGANAKSIGFVPPNPFARTAFESSIQAAEDAFQAEIKVQLEGKD